MSEMTQEKKPILASKGSIIVQGINDVAVHFSKCCSPVPGDEIVGFITRGRGISIHRNDCVNMLSLSEDDRMRLIDATWQSDEKGNDEKYLAELRVYANDRAGLLSDISKVFTEKNISIISLNSHLGKNGVVTMSLGFEISGRDELSNIIERLRNIEAVIDIGCNRYTAVKSLRFDRFP